MLGQVGNDEGKQTDMANCGGIEVLLRLCDPASQTDSRLLLPVLWSLRSSIHNSDPNKSNLLQAGGVETLLQVKQCGNEKYTKKIYICYPPPSLCVLNEQQHVEKALVQR